MTHVGGAGEKSSSVREFGCMLVRGVTSSVEYGIVVWGIFRQFDKGLFWRVTHFGGASENLSSAMNIRRVEIPPMGSPQKAMTLSAPFGAFQARRTVSSGLFLFLDFLWILGLGVMEACYDTNAICQNRRRGLFLAH